jgi:zinc transport system substrate-binding protein
VAVSIAPVHSLVQGVMHGVASAELLLKSNRSPHSGSLPPSTVRSLLSADLVVWVGPPLEGSLVKALDGLEPDRKISLLAAEGMRLRQIRPASAMHEHGGQDQKDDVRVQPGSQTTVDPHIWLSSINASIIVNTVAQWLIEHDRSNAPHYHRNAQALNAEIAGWRAKAEAELAPIRDLKFMVFHDAYQYFEHDFGLTASASVTIDPERPPGAKHLRELRHRLQADDVNCIFTEPQFSSNAVNILVEDTDVRIGMLDPLGVEIKPGREMWFRLMQGLVSGMTGCLATAS